MARYTFIPVRVGEICSKLKIVDEERVKKGMVSYRDLLGLTEN